MLYFLDLFGVCVFAVIGAGVARKHQTNWVGGILLAVITALGGGTLRDLLLGIFPVFWLRQPIYLGLAIATGFFSFHRCIASFSCQQHRFFSMQAAQELLNLANSIALATFTVVGTQVALAAHMPWWVSGCMGLLTGVGGGILRDALVAQQPIVFRQQDCAVISLLTGLLYGALVHWGWPENIAIQSAFILNAGIYLGGIAGRVWGGRFSQGRFSQGRFSRGSSTRPAVSRRDRTLPRSHSDHRSKQLHELQWWR